MPYILVNLHIDLCLTLCYYIYNIRNTNNKRRSLLPRTNRHQSKKKGKSIITQSAKWYKNMMNIYLTNLGKYNEGELIGEWVELPVSHEELQKVFERIGINEEYEEYFITDYECDFYEVGEYESLDTLNEIAERIEELGEEESEVVKALMSELGYTLNEAIDKVNSGDYRIYSDCDDMTDIAYQVVEECGYLNNVPDNVARYFDYESFSRDLGIEGTYIFTDDNNAIEIF